MSVIMNELERRKKAVATYDEKVAKLEQMQAEVAILKKEVEETDIVKLNDEINELTEDAITLGYIPKPETDELEEEVESENVEEAEEADVATRAANVFSITA